MRRHEPAIGGSALQRLVAFTVLALAELATAGCDDGKRAEDRAQPNVRPDRRVANAEWRPDAPYPVCPDGRRTDSPAEPTFVCEGSPDDTYTFYEEKLRERGWTLVGSTRLAERRILVLRIKDVPGPVPLRRATVVVEPSGNGSRAYVFESRAERQRGGGEDR